MALWNVEDGSSLGTLPIIVNSGVNPDRNRPPSPRGRSSPDTGPDATPPQPPRGAPPSDIRPGREPPTPTRGASPANNGPVRLPRPPDAGQQRADPSASRRVAPSDASPAVSLDFSPGNETLAIGQSDGRVTLWNIDNKVLMHDLENGTESVTAVTFSSDGSLLAAAGNGSDPGAGNHWIRLWNAQTGAEVQIFTGPANAVHGLVFSRDGGEVISGCGDGSIDWWDVQTGEAVQSRQGHAAPVRCLSLSPDGHRLVSCSDDGTVKIWDLLTRQELGTMNPRADLVFSVAFSPDGLQIACGTHRGSVTVWDARPLTDELRTELLAVDLLRRLNSGVVTEAELIDRIRKNTSVSDSVKERALQMAKSSLPP